MSEQDKKVERLRQSFQRGIAARDFALTTPQDVIEYNDITYGNDEKWQVLDLYRPRLAEDTDLPVIVHVHGGAWIYGAKEGYRFYCMELARHGFCVVNFSYRPAPDFPFPAQLEDTVNVFQWVVSHAGDYGMNTKCLFGMGDSAGAHILGLYVATCTNETYRSYYSFLHREKVLPAAVCFNCGSYRFGDSHTRSMDETICHALFSETCTEKELERLNVMSYITPDFPPVFLMTATGDFLRSQAQMLAETLKENHVPVQYLIYGDEMHRPGHVFHCDIKTQDARDCMKQECSYLKAIAEQK